MTPPPDAAEAFEGVGQVRREVAEELAAELHQAAQIAGSEEDLRIASESLLQNALTRIGVKTTPSYERSYADHGGRSDAVYGRVVIEYEAVGALSKQKGVEHAAEQLDRYLRAEVGGSNEVDALQRVVGVGLDGHRIFFLRFHPTGGESKPIDLEEAQGVLPIEGFEHLHEGPVKSVIDGPYLVNADSIQKFFLYLRASHRSRLTPEGLAVEFGPSGACAKQIVGHLYSTLMDNEDEPLTSTLFAEWDRIFGIVYGDDLERVGKHLTLLCDEYQIPRAEARFKPLLFSIHTYYAILMKVMAAELVAMQRESLIESFIETLSASDDTAVHRLIASIESGEAFSYYLLHNFLEADFFGWYLRHWDSEMADQVRTLARLLATFEPATGVLDPAPTQDLLKQLYQFLIPREIRHDLGEYYTPTWLVDFTLNEAGYVGQDGRLLDPACGTGSFLVSAIHRRLAWYGTHKDASSSKPVAEDILANIIGFELNPLAVIAARTNYLLAMGELLRDLDSVEIPVYMCDSVLAPTVTDLGLLGENYVINTTVGRFDIPAGLVSADALTTSTTLLEDALNGEFSASEFEQITRIQLPDLEDPERDALVALFVQIAQLREDGRDGVWPRIIRNAFAPLLSGVFEFVVGNPPWVNWQGLTDSYRRATLHLWVQYGLFTLSGSQARLGGGKKDLAALFTYRAADAYLRSGGTLGFVVPQSLFKGKQASEGFRRFQIAETGAKLGVQRVHDMEALQPFQGASTKTTVVVLRKGVATNYPVPYLIWHKKASRTRIDMSRSLDEVRSSCRIVEEVARPINAQKFNSPWMTASSTIAQALTPALGSSAYRAFIGVCTWANGIYWLRVNSQTGSGLLRVENMADEAKDQTMAPEKVQAVIEPDLLYPLVRSRDIRRWSAKPSTYILIPQDAEERKGVDESRMRVHHLNTYKYLKRFEASLGARSGMLRYFHPEKGDAFYSIYNFSTDSLGEHRVVWRQMVKRLTAAVIRPSDDAYLGQKPPQTQHVVTVVRTSTEDEAYYVCAVINSAVASAISMSYSTGKSYGLPSLMENLAIPRFDAADANHLELVELARKATLAAGCGDPTDTLDARVDIVAASVLGLSPEAAEVLRDEVATLPMEEPDTADDAPPVLG